MPKELMDPNQNRQTRKLWKTCIRTCSRYEHMLHKQARINKMNNHLEQFPPRDNGTSQVKLTEDKLMDIVENAVPKSWQGGMRRQRFDCTAKGQAKFI
eukprot:7413846-Ditylum_brightwellii.AAC.1